MKFSQNAQTVLNRRYVIRDEEGKPAETPEQLFRRVARSIAECDRAFDENADIEALAERFYDMMTSLEFLPNSPTLMNAGRPLGQLAACFVLPVEDTLDGIFESIKQAALIHKSGGGTGFSFSRLRPRGSPVNTTGGVASGPVSFMRVFNSATNAVKQGGTRRGANMGILNVQHPDILEFISCKDDKDDFTNFNISVALTEEFMAAAATGGEYDLIDPRTDERVGKLNAGDVFGRIVESSWRTGEPGIIFIDRMNADNVLPSRGKIEATNPCGEQPLLPYESCNLGSVNLLAMYDGNGGVNWDKLSATVRDSVHFLDNVIEANRYPNELIAQTTRGSRKIGLGVMGFADLLLKMGIPYNSESAVEVAGRVMSFISSAARDASRELAKSRGAFPLFAESTLSAGEPMRNATVTTIAPTGTLSIIAGVSSGIEPIFGLTFVRTVMDGDRLVEVNPVLTDVLNERGLLNDQILEDIRQSGSLTGIPEDMANVFVTAHDIAPEWHIRIQAAFQRHTDNAVSKTVNFPGDASPADIRSAFELAHSLGCKGVTIYRDGSRSEQVLTRETPGSGQETGQPEPDKFVKPRPRPEVTTGFTERVKVGCGNLYVTINYDENGVCEVFTNTGKAGGCPSQSEATARLATAALRAAVDPQCIIDQLSGIRCHSTIRQSGLKALSCPDAIAKVLAKVVDHRNGKIRTEEENPAAKPGAPACPECGAELTHAEGCAICRKCGYSRCN